MDNFTWVTHKSLLPLSISREASINYMMQFLKSKDRDAMSAIYDASVKVMTRNGMAEEKVLEAVIDEAQCAAGIKKDIRPADLFDFSFLRTAREQLKASGWKP